MGTAITASYGVVLPPVNKIGDTVVEVLVVLFKLKLFLAAD